MSDDFGFLDDPAGSMPQPQPTRNPRSAGPASSEPGFARHEPASSADDAYELQDEPVEPPINGDEVVLADVATPASSVQAPYYATGGSAPQFLVSKPRRKWPWIVALAIGVPVAAIVAFALFAWYYVKSAKELPVTEADRRVVLTADDVARVFPALEVRPSAATIKKVRYLDGSHEVEYEYEARTDDGISLYVSSSVSVEPTIDDAVMSYNSIGVGVDVGMAFAGKTTPRIRNDLFRWGEVSSHSVLEREFGPVGNVLIVRQGKHVFFATVIGVHLTDPEEISQLFTPVLERMTTYQP